MTRLAFGLLTVMASCTAASGDLLEYISRPDPTYRWSKLGEGRLDKGVTWTELVMTSQTWRNIEWKHKLLMVRPAQVEDAHQAVLIIAAGSWQPGDENRPLGKDARELTTAATIAMSTRMPVAVIKYVPFQPIFNRLHEDQAISFTFLQFLTTGEEDWPLLLPMTKSAVRAMDTAQAFAKAEWRQDIRGFVVCGASKRGWTTYLSAVADQRVKAIAPIVFDTLRLREQMDHQLATWGRFSEEIGDYTALGLQKLLDTPGGRKLVAMVDPHEYRRKLTQPKFIILGTNDRYWPLDALNLYWPDLEGEKHVLYVPNSGHGINDMKRLTAAVSALALQSAGRLTLPRLTWDFREESDGLTLAVRSDLKPRSIAAWTADAPTRDFRDSKWSAQRISSGGDTYALTLPRPREGFAAAFGEALYEFDGQPLYLSTNVRIIGPKP